MALLPRRVAAEAWRPVGVDQLEDNALLVVKSDSHRSVIAGPGAGKTELLAQRAAYLLQTAACRTPRRILAISFKRDAASNLAARVQERCHPQHAGRFDSLTFDAFAKGLVDRFGQALPDRWRPAADYQILETRDALYRGFLEQLPTPPPAVGTRADMMSINPKPFERLHLLGQPLPEQGWDLPTPGQWAADRFWRSSLNAQGGSRLSFPMIGRLAELLLRVNPAVGTALRLTFSHVFMDEFQDTTQVQYDLMRQIFLGSDAVLTAVGDNKQQIMRWALAMDEPFVAFEQDFQAVRTPLYNNYRSSPGLVRIQHVLAQALDRQAPEPVSKRHSTIPDACCAVWDFSTSDVEARRLADFVAQEMAAHDLQPRDFAILVRQKAEDYFDALEPAFLGQKLALRNEAGKAGDVMLQELLAEPASDFVVQCLRLATSSRAGRYWSEAQRSNAALRGLEVDDERGHRTLRGELDGFCKVVRDSYAAPPRDLAEARDIVAKVLDIVGRKRLTAAYAPYRQGGWLDKVIDAAARHLASSSVTGTWAEALDAYEGVHATPLMTIHKSKGLEYHTVIFVGLDDNAWWSFAGDKLEATAGFFVAFTRAKQRVVFTYCPRRGNRTKILELYQLLQSAGVPTLPMG